MQFKTYIKVVWPRSEQQVLALALGVIQVSKEAAFLAAPPQHQVSSAVLEAILDLGRSVQLDAAIKERLADSVTLTTPSTSNL